MIVLVLRLLFKSCYISLEVFKIDPPIKMLPMELIMKSPFNLNPIDIPFLKVFCFVQTDWQRECWHVLPQVVRRETNLNSCRTRHCKEQNMNNKSEEKPLTITGKKKASISHNRTRGNHYKYIKSIETD